MRTECIPFSGLPHVSKLFLDFLADEPAVRPFYPSRFLPAVVAGQASFRDYPAERRRQMTEILRRQNKNFGASVEALQAIDRFAAGAHAIITGQQVVLFGGPLLAILKALTAIRLAQQYSKPDREIVPIFWLATQDHDFAEVDHVTVLGADGASLNRFAVHTDGADHAPVAARRLEAESLEAAFTGIASALGAETAALLRECYRPGASLGDGMGRLFAKLFAEFGLILFDPSDPAVAPLAQPVYRRAITECEAITGSLLQRGKDLTAAGYHEQVKVTPGSSLLFLQQNGERTVVHRENHGFVVGKQKFSVEELQDRLESAPQEFSGNALLRPVVQDYLFPTLAYVGGPAEIAYFAQCEVVYRALLGWVTPILPRGSVTLVDPHSARILQKHSLKLPELFHGSEAVLLRVAAANLPQALQEKFEHEMLRFSENERTLTSELQSLDPTLVKATGRSFAKMRYQLTKLQGKSARAQLRRSSELARQVGKATAAVAPARNLQERERAGIDLLARGGSELLRSLYESLNPECRAHQLLYL